MSYPDRPPSVFDELPIFAIFEISTFPESAPNWTNQLKFIQFYGTYLKSANFAKVGTPKWTPSVPKMGQKWIFDVKFDHFWYSIFDQLYVNLYVI